MVRQLPALDLSKVLGVIFTAQCSLPLPLPLPLLYSRSTSDLSWEPLGSRRALAPSCTARSWQRCPPPSSPAAAQKSHAAPGRTPSHSGCRACAHRVDADAVLKVVRGHGRGASQDDCVWEGIQRQRLVMLQGQREQQSCAATHARQMLQQGGLKQVATCQKTGCASSGSGHRWLCCSTVAQAAAKRSWPALSAIRIC